LLKKTHRNNDKTNVKQEQFNATERSKDRLDEGIKDIITAPTKGNIKV
jgi:hypothetical protein